MVHFRRFWVQQRRSSARPFLCPAQPPDRNRREQDPGQNTPQPLHTAFHCFLSVFRRKRTRYFFQSTALVWLPWPTVSLVSGSTIALPRRTRFISRSRIPWSGGLIRSSAELIASKGAVIFSRSGAGS